MIGYYVHHQGQGHRARMLSIAAELSEPVTALSSLPRPDGGPDWIDLPSDDSGRQFIEPTANGTWHWVPRHHPGLRSRMARIAAWIDDADPALLVVDVSVEVAALGQLLGVPTVVMAMRGDRTDRPHALAYDGANALIAPWAAEFDPVSWPQAWRDKTFHCGPIVRPLSFPPVAPTRSGPRRVLMMWGTGGDEDGTGFTPTRAAELQAAYPRWDWRSAGGSGAHRVDQSEIGRLLQWADVVISHAGQNSVAEVAASGTPAVVIADARPHGEQHDTAVTLDRAGIAVGLPGWPSIHAWPQLLDRAVRIGGSGWTRWLTPHGAGRAAQFLTDTARTLRFESRRAPMS